MGSFHPGDVVRIKCQRETRARRTLFANLVVNDEVTHSSAWSGEVLIVIAVARPTWAMGAAWVLLVAREGMGWTPIDLLVNA